MTSHDATWRHVLSTGHILGNTLVFAGTVRRERTRFVLSKEMVHVLKCMGKGAVGRFEDLCVRAYLVLRRHAALLLNMLLMLVPACLPELNDCEDLEYMAQMLQLDCSEEEAADWLRKQLHANFGRATAWFKQLDNQLHNMKQCVPAHCCTVAIHLISSYVIRLFKTAPAPPLRLTDIGTASRRERLLAEGMRGVNLALFGMQGTPRRAARRN